MVCERKIRYLDYCKNGEKICGAGFVKLEEANDFSNLQIHVKCRSLSGVMFGKIVMQSTDKDCEIGEMELVDGEGEFGKTIKAEGRTADEYDIYKNAIKIFIVLSDGIILRCLLKSGNESGDTKVEMSAAEKKVQKDDREEEKPKQKEIMKKEALQAGMPLPDDKWEYIYSVYPHINPFKDEREYLSIKPCDFIILNETSYQCANNSFLLHGFFNYKHIILTQVERDHERQYYIGAPGNYFEREKQVAVMFGFESFECAEEPAQTGDFGYYMMRVQI